MVKAYLKYELSASFGVIASNSNLAYDRSGKFLVTASLENVSVWSIKQGILVKTLVPSPTSSGKGVSLVSHIAAAPESDQLAVGHTDGTIRLWNINSGECLLSLSGHKSAVTALRFSTTGAVLASGSKDTDVILWDVGGEAGLYRLRGHHDQVTDVAFLSRGDRLVSCSKDSYLKVWDLDTQHCSQTIVGHRGEVWSLDIDPAERRLATGSSDNELRWYSIAETTLEGTSSTGQILQPMGSVRRQGNERAACVRFDASGSMLACQSAGRVVESFRLRTELEAQKHLKRRKKRKREKSHHKSGAEGTVAGDDEPDEVLGAVDELAPLPVVRTKHKIRAFAHCPEMHRKGVVAAMALALTDNSVEVWDVNDADAQRTHAIDGAGHRSDVRTVALSNDDTLLLSASNNSVKIWNPRTAACLRTIESGYGLCALFAPGNRHVVIGTKEGTLEIIDIGGASRLESVVAHSGAVWAVVALPDGSGFLSGSADHDIKFWEWQIVGDEGEARRLSISHVRTLKMTDDVLCLRITPNGKFLAVALLDSTIKVFFLDTLKFFLSLYGHKLPVLCMDISSDSTLLVSGSADKNLKIWGLDFGDCHKSLFAHGDSIMQAAFVPNTHYVFTVGKDKLVKYWDVDKFELLLTLEGHAAEVWCIAVSSLGDFIITGSHDRSLRRWERTEEPFFVEEEREKRLESLFEADLEDTSALDRQRLGEEGGAGREAPAMVMAGRKTLDSLGAADDIVDALEAAAAESQRLQEHADAVSQGTAKDAAPTNPLMLGLPPSAYVLHALRGVKAGDLEQALLVLPFTDALRLLGYLVGWLRHGTQVELCCRVATLLVRLHQRQLVATPAARPTLITLHQQLHLAVQGLKDTLGFNLAAMRHLQRSLQDQTRAGLAGDGVVTVKRKLAEA